MKALNFTFFRDKVIKTQYGVETTGEYFLGCILRNEKKIYDVFNQPIENSIMNFIINFHSQMNKYVGITIQNTTPLEEGVCRTYLKNRFSLIQNQDLPMQMFFSKIFINK